MKQLFYLLILSVGGLCCKSVKNVNEVDSESVLFTVANDTVTTREFKYVYNKNNTTNDSAYTKEDIEEYFDLYKKFKLKIAEAKNQGIDTTHKFNREFNAYKEELKKPYLTESKITEKLVNEAYDRFKYEINASHILLRLDENASPDDTLKAYNKIIEIKEKAGEYSSFSELAKEYSEDPSAANNGGNLGYFTSFQMVYPFESAAYDTPGGQISDPVRTRFGYHIIKVLDKRKANGTVSVSHIMLRKKRNDTDSTSLRNKIFEIHELATAGASWEQLVEQYSEDINSKKKGGKLQPFKVGQMPFEFQEAAFALSEPGDISDPVKTPYGWHIIKLESRKPIDSLSNLEPLIKSRIKRDSRANLNREALVKRLKNENGFSKNEESYKMINQTSDSLFVIKDVPPSLDQTLFTISDQKYSVKQFIEFAKEEQSNSKSDMKVLLNDFEIKMNIDYEENHLKEKYYDYKMLVKEYREGIMLFQIMEDEVWQRAVEDSVGLKQFYDENKERYQWEERVNATIYKSKDSTLLAEIRSLIESGKIEEYSKKELEDKYNAQTALTLQIDSGSYAFDHNDIIKEVSKKTGIYYIENEERDALVQVFEILPEQIKPFESIKGLVISDYQNHLEKLWVEELQKKYDVNVYEKALDNVYETLVGN